MQQGNLETSQPSPLQKLVGSKEKSYQVEMDESKTCLGNVDACLVDEIIHPHSRDEQEACHVSPPSARCFLQRSMDHRTQAASNVLHVHRRLPTRPSGRLVDRSVSRSVGRSVGRWEGR